MEYIQQLKYSTAKMETLIHVLFCEALLFLSASIEVCVKLFHM